MLTGLGGMAGIIFGWMISLVSRLVFSSSAHQRALWAAVSASSCRSGTDCSSGSGRRTKPRGSIRWKRCDTNRAAVTYTDRST